MAHNAIPALHQAGMAEFRGEIEVSAHGGDGLHVLVDAVLVGVTERGSAFEISDPPGIDAHDAAAGGVDSDQIVTHHQHAARLGRSLHRTIALHADDAVDNGEAAWKKAIHFAYRTIDADVVKTILRPSIHG